MIVNPPRRRLQEIVLSWDTEGHAYQRLLAEILFHADLRFGEYIQFQDEGSFPVRLWNWLNNVSDARQQRSLFRLLQWVIFIDQRQMKALYRDAYRRVIVPWVAWSRFNSEDFVAEDYEERLRDAVVAHEFFSVTESLNFPEFEHTNSLGGLRRGRRLGEDRRRVSAVVPDYIDRVAGVIVLEDFVGSGKQAGDILLELRRHVPSKVRILFVPLIILQQGLESLETRLRDSGVDIGPVLVVRKATCLLPRRQEHEPPEFAEFRSVVKTTAKRVLRRHGRHDDPPGSPFGYKDCGTLLVTCHNVPNNALPLLHHRAPTWSPLFRRLHHSKDGL